jgi:hypothetical protein
MFFLFGWGRRTLKDYGATYAVKCPNCNNSNFWNLVHLRLWFTLFFIPVFPYESKHLILCPVCQNGIRLTGQQVKRAIELNQHTLAFINKTMDRDQYAARLAQLDPLGIEPSGAPRAMPIASPDPASRPAPPPLPRQRNVQLSYYDGHGVVQSLNLTKPMIVLGSAPHCDVVEPGLAPEHCRIYARGDGYYAEDLGGGITVNEDPGSNDIHDNDVLIAGDRSFRFNIF